MKRNIRWSVSPGAAVLFALVYFFDDAGLVAALLPAAAVHELGHALALYLRGSRVTAVSVGVFGIRMDYAGSLSRENALLSLAAGPAAGILYAAAALWAGGDYLRLSAVLSLGLSAFNLLPVLPLDGGRILAELAGEGTAARASRLLSMLLLPAGAAVLLLSHSPMPLAVALWLCLQNLPDGFPGKNPGKNG